MKKKIGAWDSSAFQMDVTKSLDDNGHKPDELQFQINWIDQGN